MSYVILSSEAPLQLKNYLKDHGHIVYTIIGCGVSDPVRCHADMFLCHLGDEVIYAFENEIISGYPDETAFNALRMGNTLFCRKQSASPRLLAAAERAGIRVMNVNQGYAACSVCKVNETAAITSDMGMADAMENCGIDVLRIGHGGILLPGYNEGFIGGASGTVDNTLIFCGDITLHPDWKKIEYFLKKHHRKYKFFSNMPLFDIGGIVELKQSADFGKNASFTLTRYL